EQAELRGRELGARPVDVRLDVVGVELQLLDLDPGAATRLGVADASAGSRARSSGQLLHRERLHEVVVGADLECVNAVVLGPPCGDDDDGRADALVSSLLDDAPAVDAGKHEIEDAYVRPLVAQAWGARP